MQQSIVLLNLRNQILQILLNGLATVRKKSLSKCLETERIIILNRVNKIGNEWNGYARETVMCVGIGKTIDEETAIASENDILTVLNHIKERHG